MGKVITHLSGKACKKDDVHVRRGKKNVKS